MLLAIKTMMNEHMSFLLLMHKQTDAMVTEASEKSYNNKENDRKGEREKKNLTNLTND